MASTSHLATRGSHGTMAVGKKLLFLAIAAVLIVAVGLFGLSATFSDLGPGETWAFRIATLLGAYVLGSVGVGFLLNKWWPAAVACSWGSVLWGGLSLFASARQGEWTASSKLPLDLLVVPALCLLGGFAGFRLKQRPSQAGLKPGPNQ